MAYVKGKLRTVRTHKGPGEVGMGPHSARASQRAS